MTVCAKRNENTVPPNEEMCSTGTISTQSVADVSACSIPCVRYNENTVLPNKRICSSDTICIQSVTDIPACSKV